MGQRWQSCKDTKPDSDRIVLVARPDSDNAEPGHWFAPERAWVDHATHIQIYPSMWRDLPPHPFASI